MASTYSLSKFRLQAFRRFALCTLVGLVLGAPVRPSAAATPADELIKQGLDLRRAGRNVDALAKFEAAYGLERSPRASAQWGLCLQAVGRWSEADPLLEEALSAGEDKWIKKNRTTLKESQETVKAHVGRIEVIGDPSGATITVAGKVVGTFPLAAAVTVNEGSVDVEAAAGGYKRATRTVTVTGASYQRVVLRLEELPGAAGAPSLATEMKQNQNDPAVDLSPTPDTTDMPRPLTTRPLFWVGVAAVVVAAIGVSVALSSGTQDPKFDEERRIQ